jgi:hypothetical protein
LALVPARNEIALQIRIELLPDCDYKDYYSDDEDLYEDESDTEKWYPMKEELCDALQTFRSYGQSTRSCDELQQMCNALLELESEWVVYRSYLRTMDKIAAIGIELDQEEIFQKARRLIEARLNDDSHGGFDPKATLRAIAHRLREPRNRSGCDYKYLNWYISEQGTLRLRNKLCNRMIQL